MIIPNDSVYVLKKVLNYKVFNNPILISELADLVNSEVIKYFGINSIDKFILDDDKREIMVCLNTARPLKVFAPQDIFTIMNTIAYNAYIDIFKSNSTTIIQSILELANGDRTYVRLFNDIIGGNSHIDFICMLWLCSVYVYKNKETNTDNTTIIFRLY